MKHTMREQRKILDRAKDLGVINAFGYGRTCTVTPEFIQSCKEQGFCVRVAKGGTLLHIWDELFTLCGVRYEFGRSINNRTRMCGECAAKAITIIRIKD